MDRVMMAQRSDDDACLRWAQTPRFFAATSRAMVAYQAATQRPSAPCMQDAFAMCLSKWTQTSLEPSLPARIQPGRRVLNKATLCPGEGRRLSTRIVPALTRRLSPPPSFVFKPGRIRSSCHSRCCYPPSFFALENAVVDCLSLPGSEPGNRLRRNV